jgi:hypothetical protein
MNNPTDQMLNVVQVFFNEEGLTTTEYIKYLTKRRWKKKFPQTEPRYQLKWMDKKAGPDAKKRVNELKKVMEEIESDALYSLFNSLQRFKAKTLRNRRV